MKVKIIFLLLCFSFLTLPALAQNDIPPVDLVEEYNLYSTNKILITTYKNGEDVTLNTIAGQQEVAQMMRALESAEAVFLFEMVPDYYVKFYTEDEFIFGFSYYVKDELIYIGRDVYRPSEDFISLIESYISQD
jgi:hypothetical protein